MTEQRRRRFLGMAAALVIAVVILSLRDLKNEKSILKSSQRKRVPTFCIESSRCKHLNIARKFSFVHISKCAGASWRRELKLLGLNLFPVGGRESSVAFQNSMDPYSFLSYHLVSLKSPRHHVYSLFTECKYDPWGKKMINQTLFPRDGVNDEADFNEWLNHFLDQQLLHPAGVDRYNCYHPANYQSQFFSTDYSATQSHGYRSNNVPLASFNPKFNRVNLTFWSFDWVALADFYHESKCLLYHRLVPKNETIVEYLQKTCACGNEESKTGTDIKIQHHEEGHRSKLRTLPEEILNKVAILTRVDTRLYVEALHQFLREIVWLESELGRRVLCDPVLEKHEEELAYLNVSVTGLYWETKKG